MTRIKVKVCLCTLFIFSQLHLASLTANVFKVSDLPVPVDRIFELKEKSAPNFMANQSGTVGIPDCRMFDRIALNEFSDISHADQKSALTLRQRQDELVRKIFELTDTNNVTCPVESKIASDSQPAGNGLNQLWSQFSLVLQSQNSKLVEWIHSFDRSTVELGKSVGLSVVDSIGSIRFDSPLIELASASDISTYEVKFDVNKQGVDLIKLPGEPADGYWQYYDDCQRWGVDFSHLIIEAETAPTFSVANSKVESLANVFEPRMVSPSAALISLASAPLAQDLVRQLDYQWIAHSIREFEFVTVESFPTEYELVKPSSLLQLADIRSDLNRSLNALFDLNELLVEFEKFASQFVRVAQNGDQSTH